MLEGGRISYNQLVLLLILMVAATAVLFVPTITAREAGSDGWISLMIPATLFGVLVVLVVTALGGCFPRQTVFEYLPHLLGPAGKVVGMAYVFFFLHITSIMVREFADFLVAAFLPETPIIVFSGALVLVCAYGVRLGLEVLGRSAEWVGVLFLGSIGLILLLLLPEFRSKNLLPVMGEGVKPVLRGALAPSAWRGEVVVLLILMPYLNFPGEARKAGLVAVGALGMLLTLVTVMGVGVLGGMTAVESFPFFAMARYISVGQFLDRVEAMILVIWVAGGVVKVTAFYYLAVLGAAQTLNLNDYRPLVLPAGALMLAWSIGIHNSSPEMVEWLAKTWPPYAYTFELGIPALLLVLAAARGAGRKGGKSNGQIYRRAGRQG